MAVTEEEPSPICEMVYFAVTDGSAAHVQLWAPEYDTLRNQFFCKVCVDGVGAGGVEKVYSDYSFGALVNSIFYISITFARSDVEYRTEWRDMPHMYFPKMIPWAYGTDVYDRLCAMVDAEVQKIEDDLTRRREADPDWNEGD